MQRWGLGWCLPASSSLQRHQGPVFPPLHSVYEDYFPLLSPIPCYFTQRQLSPLPHALFHSPSCAKPTCQGGGKAASRCFAAALPSLRGWQVKQMTRVYLFYFKFFFFFNTSAWRRSRSLPARQMQAANDGCRRRGEPLSPASSKRAEVFLAKVLRLQRHG